MLSILHFMSNPYEHHDFLLHISLNIGRVREIHWYSDDLHHTSFISMALFLIFIKVHFPVTGGRNLLSGRRRWWFPPPPPRVHPPGPWIWFPRFNLVHSLCLLHLMHVVARLTQAHRVTYDLDHPLMPRQLMKHIVWGLVFSIYFIFFLFSVNSFHFQKFIKISFEVRKI